jgi:AraC-like DNA-binding protein
MNTSPIDYFQRQKLTWASRLLVHSFMSVKEIAFRLGYEDPLYFSARFKRTFGLGPREFRERGRGGKGVLSGNS